MIDLQLQTGPDNAFDLALAGADIDVADGLQTTVLVALFTDARAGADDGLTPGTDPRGHWGDTFTDAPMGSLLWLIDRAKITPDLVPRIREYALTALQRGVVDPGHALAADVDVRRTDRDRIDMTVTIDAPEPLHETVEKRLQLSGLDVNLVIRADREMHKAFAQLEGF